MPLITSLFLLQPLRCGGGGGGAVGGILGSSFGLSGFQQGAHVPAGDVSLRGSFLSPAFRRASPPGVSKYGHFSPGSSIDPHSVSARREQQLCLPGKGKYASAEIHLSAYGIILCAVNEVLVMGVDASQRKSIQQEVLYNQCITDRKKLN